MGQFVHDFHIRVRYSETDRMGYLYNAHYAAYFEVARVEALRELGVVYKDLEDQGILLPVHDYHIRHHQPAHYDDELLIRTTLTPPKGVRLLFDFELFNSDMALLAKAEVILVFVQATDGKPCRPPEHLVKKLAQSTGN